jgi:hypothetical protein
VRAFGRIGKEYWYPTTSSSGGSLFRTALALANDINAEAIKQADDLTLSSCDNSPHSAILLLQRSSRAPGTGAIALRVSGAP